MSEHISKRHNKSLLLYHIVCSVKYGRQVIEEDISETMKQTCIGISERYEINFIEIGTDTDHVHFLVQSVPTQSPKAIVQIIKSITGMEIFRLHLEVKKELWGGKFWTSGYYINTIGQYGNEALIRKYVEEQGKEYHQVYRSQLTLFEGI